ncbi:MAG: hypothetical protein ACKVRO_05330 [Micropepsaceae bacterium]
METALPFLFPVLFAALWFGVTSLLGWWSGWYALMERYPDKSSESASLKLTWQTGAMGPGVNYKSVLKLGVCPSGLRVGVLRFFGFFARDFLVPWREIKVKRSPWFWNDVAELSFGNTGKLVVLAATADRLAAAAGKQWPEAVKRK